MSVHSLVYAEWTILSALNHRNVPVFKTPSCRVGLGYFFILFFLSSSGYLRFDAQDGLSLNVEKLRGEKERINRNGICIPRIVWIVELSDYSGQRLWKLNSEKVFGESSHGPRLEKHVGMRDRWTRKRSSTMYLCNPMRIATKFVPYTMLSSSIFQLAFLTFYRNNLNAV